MAHVEKSIDVRAPVDEVYDTLSNFEEHPNFMEGLRAVRKLSPYRVHFVENWGGTPQEWDARITDSTTNRRLAWTSESGDRRETEVVLEPLGRNTTRVYYAYDFEPRGVIGSPGGRSDMAENRVIGDLRRMKNYIETERGRMDETRGRMDEARGRMDETRGRMMETGKRSMESMVNTPKLNPLEWASASVLTIGGVNWALHGLFDIDLIENFFGKHSIASKALYAGIGASAVYTMVGLIRSDIMARRHEQEHEDFDQMETQSEFERRSAYV